MFSETFVFRAGSVLLPIAALFLIGCGGTSATTAPAPTPIPSPLTTGVTLAASTSSPSFGASVTLTATVSPATATGTVTFYDGTTALGSGTLSGGVATLATTTLPVGVQNITATYAGASTYSSSTSNAVAVTVAAAVVTVTVYETTSDGKQLLAQQPSVTFGSAAGTGSFTVQVTPATVLQPWDGVGGALTDSAASVIAALPAAQQQTVLQDLFSTTNGAGFNMVRLPMGSSDFSTIGDYSYDDVPTGQTDPTLANFSIVHDEINIIPELKAAYAINPLIKLIAVPMSPPAWMKTDDSMNGVSGASTAVSQILAADFPYLANYFVKFLQDYSAQGLPIYAISAQNEPLNTASGAPTAILTATDEATFIANNLGPALQTAQTAGLSPVKIFGMEDNWADTAYAQTLLQSSAAQYLAGTSFHWYEGIVSAMSTVQALNTNKGVWFTESTGTVSCPTKTTCPTLTGSTFSAAGFATQMQELTIGVPQNSGRSVMGWNLVLNQNEGPQNNGCYDCVGVMTINSNTSPASMYFNNTYYALGHIGKFVTPGANVIGTTTQTTTGVQDVGFLNPDGSLVVVAFNGAAAAETITVASNGMNFNYTMPAGAAVTFKWHP
jgi:glucosylceramidase